MWLVISDLSKIGKKCIFLKKYATILSPKDKIRFENFTNQKRKLQFLVGRIMIYHFLGRNFKIEKSGKLTHKNTFLSLTHSHNLVVLALSKYPIGVDAEYTLKKRNFEAICHFLNWKKCSDLNDFYRKYTEFEADFKIADLTENPVHSFLSWDEYIICIASTSQEILEVFEYTPD